MKTAALISICIALSGCGVVGVKTELTVAEKCNLIQTTSSVGTVLGLRYGVKDDAERVEMATKVYKAAGDVRDVLDDFSLTGVSFETVDSLLAHIKVDLPVEVRALLANAEAVLFTFIQIPSNDDIAGIIGRDNITYARAFVQGVLDGSGLVMTTPR